MKTINERESFYRKSLLDVIHADIECDKREGVYTNHPISILVFLAEDIIGLTTFDLESCYGLMEKVMRVMRHLNRNYSNRIQDKLDNNLREDHLTFSIVANFPWFKNDGIINLNNLTFETEYQGDLHPKKFIIQRERNKKPYVFEILQAENHKDLNAFAAAVVYIWDSEVKNKIKNPFIDRLD